MLLNLNWAKGLAVWNRIFKFFDNDADLKRIVDLGTKSAQPTKGRKPPAAPGSILGVTKNFLLKLLRFIDGTA